LSYSTCHVLIPNYVTIDVQAVLVETLRYPNKYTAAALYSCDVLLRDTIRIEM